jgi:hypothetical protein
MQIPLLSLMHLEISFVIISRAFKSQSRFRIAFFIEIEFIFKSFGESKFVENFDAFERWSFKKDEFDFGLKDKSFKVEGIGESFTAWRGKD